MKLIKLKRPNNIFTLIGLVLICIDGAFSEQDKEKNEVLLEKDANLRGLNAAGSRWAQCSASKSFNPIAGIGGASDITSQLPDDSTTLINLPFDFPWFGKTIKSVRLTSNGQINIDSTNTDFNSAVTSIGSYGRPRIAFAQDDLDPSKSGKVLTLTRFITSEGKNSLTISFENIRFYPGYGTVNAQVELFSDGDVHICYGEGVMPNYRDIAAGIEDPMGGAFPIKDSPFNHQGLSLTNWPSNKCWCYDGGNGVPTPAPSTVPPSNLPTGSHVPTESPTKTLGPSVSSAPTASEGYFQCPATSFQPISGMADAYDISGQFLGDEPILLELPFKFNWFDTKIDSVRLSLNGQINIDTSDLDNNPGLADPIGTYRRPRIAIAQRQRILGDTGKVIVMAKNNPDSLLISFEDVKLRWDDGFENAQVELFPNGRVNFCYGKGSLPFWSYIASGLEDPNYGSFPITGDPFSSDGRTNQWPADKCWCFKMGNARPSAAPSISPPPTISPSVSLAPTNSLGFSECVATKSFEPILGTYGAEDITSYFYDDSTVKVHLPFDYEWFDIIVSKIRISSNGQINIYHSDKEDACCHAIPMGDYHNPRIAFVQSDLKPNKGGNIVSLAKTNPDSYIVSFENVKFHKRYGHANVQVELFPDGNISICYGEGNVPWWNRRFAAGVEDPDFGVFTIPGSKFGGDGIASEWPANQCWCFRMDIPGPTSAPVKTPAPIVTPPTPTHTPPTPTHTPPTPTHTPPTPTTRPPTGTAAPTQSDGWVACPAGKSFKSIRDDIGTKEVTFSSDDSTTLIQLPFQYQWFDRFITRIQLSNNGQININFTDTDSNCCGAKPIGSYGKPRIAFVHRDLYPPEGEDVFVLSKATGHSFIISFEYYLVTRDFGLINAQIELFPNGNVHFCYGRVMVPFWEDIAAGLEDPVFGSFPIREAPFNYDGITQEWPTDSCFCYKMRAGPNREPTPAPTMTVTPTASPSIHTTCPRKFHPIHGTSGAVTSFLSNSNSPFQDTEVIDLGFAFPWIDQTTVTSIRITDNGNINMDPSNTSSGCCVAYPINGNGWFGHARIAVAQSYLEPRRSINGHIVTKKTADSVMVSWEDVPQGYNNGYVNAQVTLYRTGHVSICYGEGDLRGTIFHTIVGGMEDGNGLGYPLIGTPFGEGGEASIWPGPNCYCYAPFSGGFQKVQFTQ